ncbi:MAG: hypothetical protein ACRDON_04860 [Gaiellaceae bacterium]
MRILGVLVGLVIALAACDGSSGEDPGVPLGPVPGPDAGEKHTVDVYAAVVRRLVTKDHTFGGAPSPFKRVYVVDGAVVGAGDPLEGNDVPGEPFPAAVKEGMALALADLPDVEFVADPDSVIVEENECGQVKGGGVLISLGPIKGRGGGKVTVGNELFFACLGGQWLTYVLEPVETGWRVVGTTGPAAIS